MIVCVTMWVCGCVGVWVCGCVGVWVCGCVGVWVCGCLGPLWVGGCLLGFRWIALVYDFWIFNKIDLEHLLRFSGAPFNFFSLIPVPVHWVQDLLQVTLFPGNFSLFLQSNVISTLVLFTCRKNSDSLTALSLL
jgi:hypothetical protein